MSKTKIQWTDKTWNLTSGCKKVSDGCKNCYAEVMHSRLTAMKSPKYLKPFNEFQMHESEINKIPGGKGKMVFINSMSDFFHDDMEISFIDKVLAKIDANPDNIYQVLTKRSENIYEKLYGQDGNKEYLMRELGGNDFINNLWIGVTVENKATKKRIKDLTNPDIVSQVKFLSIEPLLEDLELTVSELKGIDWVIVGGESGKSSRPINKEWVEAIQRTCREAKVPFFFKQWGGVDKKKNGRLLNGKIYDEMPEEFNNIKFSEYFNYLEKLGLDKVKIDLGHLFKIVYKEYDIEYIKSNEDILTSKQISNIILKEMLPVINDLTIELDEKNPLQVYFELRNETIFNLTGFTYDIEYNPDNAKFIAYRMKDLEILDQDEVHPNNLFEYLQDYYYTLESPAVSVKLSKIDFLKKQIKDFNLSADLTNKSIRILNIIDSARPLDTIDSDLIIHFIDKNKGSKDNGISFIIDNTERKDFIAFKMMESDLNIIFVDGAGEVNYDNLPEKKRVIHHLDLYYKVKIVHEDILNENYNKLDGLIMQLNKLSTSTMIKDYITKILKYLELEIELLTVDLLVVEEKSGAKIVLDSIDSYFELLFIGNKIILYYNYNKKDSYLKEETVNINEVFTYADKFINSCKLYKSKKDLKYYSLLSKMNNSLKEQDLLSKIIQNLQEMVNNLSSKQEG